MKYIMTGSKNGYQITYLCALCDYHYSTGLICAGSEEEAKLLTEKEARKYFNGCRKCGRWICDEHYNMAEMLCVKCANEKKNIK